MNPFSSIPPSGWVPQTPGLSPSGINRKTRRQVAAIDRKRSDHNREVAAAHEAGHAVAKMLCAPLLGYEPNDVIEFVQIGGVANRRRDDRILLSGQGVVRGRSFSKQMEAVLKDILVEPFDAVPEVKDLTSVVDAARSQGADIDEWFSGRAFECMSGPVAEAIFTGELFRAVWSDRQSTSDQLSILRDAEICRISRTRMQSIVDRMGALSALVLDSEHCWAGLLAIANRLRSVGRLDGIEVFNAFHSHSSISDFAKFIVDARARLSDFEGEIRISNLVLAESLGGKGQFAIKGRGVIDTARAHSSGGTLAATIYRCRSPVLAEMLWRAFGDGADSP
ncbi:MAG: hypothetical protein K2Y71_15740 [Xanthobacteraceae bacterium]|nr:hypothetical protein [Xanthobacteraceae bacterium]